MTSSLYRWVICFVLLVGFSQNLAASPAAELIIRPSVCMINKLGDTCSMKVKVTWHNAQAVNACLYQNDLQLKCWEKVDNINTDIDITLDQDMNFILKNDQHIFANQYIKINTALPKKYRRRLRANWSFF